MYCSGNNILKKLKEGEIIMRHSGRYSSLRTVCVSLCFLFAVLFLVSFVNMAKADDWVCPTCGRNNTEDMNFCGNCRTAKPVAEIDPSEAINGWVCSGCGKINPSTDNFCTKCGSDHYETDQKAILADKPVFEAYQMDPCTIQCISCDFGEMNSSYWSYIYTAPVSGSYTLWVEDQSSSFLARFLFFDMNDKLILAHDFNVNTPYATYSFTAGQKVRITLAIYSGYDDQFSLCIGEPREKASVQVPCVIADNVNYGDQVNRYVFTPASSGVYNLQLTEVMNGQELDLIVKDELDYVIARAERAAMGRYKSFEVEAGNTYYIFAVQSGKNIGNYKLMLSCPNPVLSINGVSAVGDYIYYPEQENRYSYTAPATGTYTFSFGNIDPDNQFAIDVYDEFGNRAGDSQGAGTCTAKLETGKVYQIAVKQKTGTGYYTLLINTDQEDISNDMTKLQDASMIGKATLKFGHYEQDNDESNGPEEIEWVVIDMADGNALLISKEILDRKRYNTNYTETTWEECSLRMWLNDEFYNTAFSEAEKTAIQAVEADNSSIQGEYAVDGGNNTRDKVFLLSYHEAKDKYFTEPDSAICFPTAYAEWQGADRYRDGGGYWWLRSPGRNLKYASYVNPLGSCSDAELDIGNIGVRPAIWVKLELPGN